MGAVGAALTVYGAVLLFLGGTALLLVSGWLLGRMLREIGAASVQSESLRQSREIAATTSAAREAVSELRTHANRPLNDDELYRSLLEQRITTDENEEREGGDERPAEIPPDRLYAEVE